MCIFATYIPKMCVEGANKARFSNEVGLSYAWEELKEAPTSSVQAVGFVCKTQMR